MANFCCELCLKNLHRRPSLLKMMKFVLVVQVLCFLVSDCNAIPIDNNLVVANIQPRFSKVLPKELAITPPCGEAGFKKYAEAKEFTISNVVVYKKPEHFEASELHKETKVVELTATIRRSTNRYKVKVTHDSWAADLFGTNVVYELSEEENDVTHGLLFKSISRSSDLVRFDGSSLFSERTSLLILTALYDCFGAYQKWI